MLLTAVISLLILSVIFFLSLLLFIRFSPKEEGKKESVFRYNSIFIFLSILLCAVYSYYSIKSYMDSGETGKWLAVSIMGSLLISSICLAGGHFIRLIIFRKAYPGLSALLLLAPPMISFLLLAVHFIREGNTLFASIIFVLLFPLIIVSEPQIAKAAQAALILAALEWVRAGYALVAFRIQNNEPWIRVIIIFSGVICFTLLSALLFYAKPLKKRYGIKRADP
ncbi:MAG: hypothetical protein AB1498_09950 [bacterium]